MAALSLGKKKICALALLVMLDKVENEDTGRRFWVRKIFQERKKYGLYHILTDELRLFDKEYFFRFVRMTPQRFRFVRMTTQRFEHLLSLAGPFCTPIASRSSSAFPIFSNIVFQVF